MPKARSPNRDKAFDIYKQNNGNIQLVEIARQLEETDSTIRGWKSKDKWDSKLNGAFQTKDMERSDKKNTNNKKTEKKSSSLIPQKNNVPIMDTNTNIETNTQTKNVSMQRFGNKNAVGNKGGNGAPMGNKFAVTTGEYENIFNSAFSDDELSVFNCEIDIYTNLELELRLWTTREYKMLMRIKKLENVKGEMLVDSITKLESETRGEFDTTTKSTETVVKNISDKILKVEEALTRVQANKAKIIERIHKFSLDKSKLEIEKIRLKLYKNKLDGVINYDEMLEGDLEDLLKDLDLE